LILNIFKYPEPTCVTKIKYPPQIGFLDLARRLEHFYLNFVVDVCMGHASSKLFFVSIATPKGFRV
jgi:hypothetical protein